MINPGSYRWWQEPLLHFLVLAAMLFVLDYWSAQSQKTEIVVSRQTVDYLVDQQQQLELRELTGAERQQVVEQFIEDEILYAEAYKRGLDKGDSRMRRNLILKMRGLLGGEVGEPSKEQLQDYYKENQTRYVTPATWRVEQVFYSDSDKVPDALLERLNAGEPPENFGEERLDMRRIMPGISQQQLVSVFGPDVARQLMVEESALPRSGWVGPVETDFGVHVLRVTGFTPAKAQPYEQVERFLAGEWVLDQSRARIEQEVELLRDDYLITIEGAAE